MADTKSVYNVSGMDCADCALHVENSVKKIPGFTDVKVNFLTGTLELKHHGNKSADAEIIQAVHSAGYKILQPKQTISLFKISGNYSPTMIRETVKKLEKNRDITKITYHSGDSKLSVNHTIPVAEIVSLLENTNLDFTFIGTKKESQESNRTDMIRIIICSTFLTIGLILYYTTAMEIPAKASFLMAILSGGYPVALKGWKELRSLKPGMNLLMSVAVIGAVILGEWTEGSMVIFLFTLAQYLESWSITRARNSIGNLMEERPVTARVVDGNKTRIIAVEMVRKGDIIAVKPGERIPTDGKIISGSSFIDQSMITGESMPVKVSGNSVVYAGTLNKNGYLQIEATSTYPESTYNKITQLATQAQTQKAPQQKFVEKFARYYTPVVMFAALSIAVFPPLLADLSWNEWIYRALVLLVIACPCAFVISTPVTIISGLTNAIRKGIMIKGGLYLENFSKVNTIAFDKTGTLTRGEPEVQKVISLQSYEEELILSFAASLEMHSDHPLAQAIVSHTEKQSISFKKSENIQSLEGRGVSGVINGETILVGSHRMFEEKGICNGDLHEDLQLIEDENHTAVLVGKNNIIIGIIAITDKLREESISVLQELRRSGIRKISLLTGDNQRTAATIGKVLDIRDIHAELLPEDKLKIINELRRNNDYVAMVGDGINDAPALAAADIGIAMAVRGSDTALETADIALMDDDLTKIPYLKKLSNTTIKIVKQNLLIALLLKFTFLALAIPGYATLWMAVFADMGASLLVIFNGLRALQVKQ